MDPDKRAKWPSHLRPILIAYNATRSLITGYSPYFLMFGHQPRLPVNLLFPTVRQDENSRTTDEYITSLYDKLKSALASARDTAILEAQRQKRLYDHKARAVELHPGDKVLVKLDAFRGQWQKLKNRWGDTLHTVVKCVADGIPAYEVENNVNKKRQVLHRARLLLWLAEPEGEPLRINCISIESGLTGAELVKPLCRIVNLGVVPHKLIYGLNMAMFESRQELPDLTMSDDAQGVVTGPPRNGTGPVTSSLAREPCGPCLETSLQDEHDLSDDDLKHDPAMGGRKQDGLAVNGDAGHLSTQVTANKLVVRTTPMQVTGLSHPSFFFRPPISHARYEGMPSFLTGGGEIEMQLL